MGSGYQQVSSEWVDGNQIFKSVDGTEIARYDGAAGLMIVPNAVKQLRQRVTLAQVNAGLTLLPAVPGFKYRMVDAALIAIAGASSGATSVDILATQSSSGVKLMAGLVAGLTENTLLRAGAATNGVILAAGLSFVANDANTVISIGNTGSDLATSTSIDVLLTYVLEAA